MLFNCKNMKKNMLEKLISLHKYWIHCNICYNGFKNYVSTNVDTILESIKELDFLKFHLLNLDHHGFYRSYWYSSLYVVVEGYMELKLNIPEVDELLVETEFVDKLRLFRNSIFHYQKDIYNSKFLGVDDSDEFVEWIYKLHILLGKKIMEEMYNSLPKETAERIKDSVKNINK